MITSEQRKHANAEWKRKYGEDVFTTQAKLIFLEGYKSATPAEDERHPICVSCEYYPCDMETNAEYCPIRKANITEDEPLSYREMFALQEKMDARRTMMNNKAILNWIKLNGRYQGAEYVEINLVELKQFLTAEDECPKCGQSKCLQHGYYTATEPEDELSTEQKEQRRLDDKMIHLFHMILDSQIKLYDAFQTLTEPEDEPEGWQKEMMADYVRDDGYEQEDS